MRDFLIAPKLCGLLSSMVLSLNAGAGELARWQTEPSAGPERIRLLPGPDSDWQVEKATTWQVVRPKPGTDLYARAAYQLSFEPMPTSNCWVVIEFLDQGYGLISVSPGVASTRQWGTARVNSGELRRAVFQYGPSLPRQIRVEGLDFLHAVIVTDERPLLEQAPITKPAVRFAVPSERVTTAGGDSASPDQVADDFSSRAARVTLANGKTVEIPSYEMAME